MNNEQDNKSLNLRHAGHYVGFIRLMKELINSKIVGWVGGTFKPGVVKRQAGQLPITTRAIIDYIGHTPEYIKVQLRFIRSRSWNRHCQA